MEELNNLPEKERNDYDSDNYQGLRKDEDKSQKNFSKNSKNSVKIQKSENAKIKIAILKDQKRT